ncbi:tetratricopeptide repeat-containing diguanylate cyclase [Filibacter tadaridae]|uniref:Response regulator PleD n=1 Tax=Filibacter tadaridae TaxID=2483811 RepID=A0A3P5WTD8_9BACL|nr:tetratricopeptide repeat-containing diguanylate cyclase [Filibacter tadaridae]VDC24888.1 Response regulator PleD [Filibacter tadaridae]
MDKSELILLQKKVTSLRSEGNYKESINACYQLLENGMKLNDTKSILIAHMNNAFSYYSIGALEEAFNSIEVHEELCNIHGDEEDQLNSLLALFFLHEYNKDYDKAKYSIKQTILLGKKLKHYDAVSMAYNNYSTIHAEEGNYEKALEMAETALVFAKCHEPMSPILEFRIKMNSANAYIGLNEFAASKVLIDELMNDSILDPFSRKKAQLHSLQGRWYMKQQFYKEAFESLTDARNLAASYTDIHLLKVIQEQRVALCELMNDVHTGYEVQKEYILLLTEIGKRDLALAALKLDVKHTVTSIEKRANTDYLTGLYNRSYMETTTDLLLKQAVTRNESIVCIVLDLDNLKAINDRFGHLYGDEMIKLVSQTCSATIRREDLIGRFGGDEFVIILNGVSLEDGKKKAEQLAEVVQHTKLEIDGEIIDITASIGISDNSECTTPKFKELFHRADMALYEAKTNGKNQICCR